MENEGRTSSPKAGEVQYRPTWVVYLSVGIRAMHQIGAAVFLSCFLMDFPAVIPPFYLWLAVLSGLALIGAELMRHRQMYREVSGAGTLLKLVVLGIAYHGLLPPATMVTTAFVIAAIAAHLPKNIRHRMLF